MLGAVESTLLKTQASGVGGIIAHDDYVDYPSFVDIEGYLPSLVDNGEVYDARHKWGQSTAGTAPSTRGTSDDVISGSLRCSGIDSKVASHSSSVKLRQVDLAGCFVGGDAVPNGNNPAYAVYFNAGSWILFTNGGISLPTIVGTPGVGDWIKLEFIPSTRLTILLNDVNVYELTSGVQPGVGNYAGVLTGGWIDEWKLESL